MNEFSAQQIGILERLVAKEFILVAFPMYANAVGVRKGSCAALLDPIPNGGFRVFGEPCVLLDGNLTGRITKKGKTWVAWRRLRSASRSWQTSSQKFNCCWSRIRSTETLPCVGFAIAPTRMAFTAV